MDAAPTLHLSDSSTLCVRPKWVLSVADPCAVAQMDHSSFMHTLGDGTFGVFPVGGH